MASGKSTDLGEPGHVDSAADAEVQRAKDVSASSLDLSFRDLHRLPRGLGEVESLRQLDLRSNQIFVLGEASLEGSSVEDGSTHGCVGEAQSGCLLPRALRVLRVSSNSARVLADSLLHGLDALQELEAHSNCLRTLPPSLLACRSVTELDLHRNQLESLPSALGRSLPQLRHLDVSYNRLKSLPDSLGELQYLEHLSAKFNKLEQVPASLGRATSLRHLDLSCNFVNLTSIPGSLGFLTRLTFLDLSNNQITTVPVQLGRLTDLELLGLEGNPLTFPPYDLLTLEVPEGAQGSMSKEEASKAASKASTEVVKAFLAGKLKEWDEHEWAGSKRGTWEAWVHDWPILEWLTGLFASSPALEGAMVSSVPRPALPPPALPEDAKATSACSLGVARANESPLKAVASFSETVAFVESKAPSTEELLQEPQLPESSLVAMPFLDDTEDNREEHLPEACLA